MKIQAIRQGICRRLSRGTALSSALLLSVTVLSVDAAAQDDSSLLGQNGKAASGVPNTGAGVLFRNGQLVSDGQAFTVIDPSQVKTAAGSLASQPGNEVDQVGFGDAGAFAAAGCRSCGTASCGGSCGVGGGGFGGGGFGGFAGGGGCGEPCIPYRYVHSEAIYMKRLGDDNFTVSESFGLDDFDWEIGPRITLGIVPDCVHGWEAGFTGPLEWNRSASTVLNPGAFNAFQFPGAFFDHDLNPATPVVARPEYDPFYDADRQTMRHNAEYFSFEASKTLIGWQIAKILYGVRYIDYQEDFLFTSVKSAGPITNAEFLNRTENHLIGGQVGLDLFYPIARHAVADFRGRAGAYLNFAETDSRLFNSGSVNPVRRRSREDEELAGVFEIGSGVRFNLGEALSIRAGSELWYLTGIATSVRESRNLSVDRNEQISIDEDVVMVGLTVSAEFKY